MSERVETVRLTANISNYLAGMEQARLATGKLAADSATRLAAQRQAFTQLGFAVTAIGVVAAAAVAVSVAKFAEFDQAMSNVQAATQETTANMGLLRAAALEAGASTVFTATEAANAIEELGKNGLSTAQILNGGLSGALALASSGQLGVARAAEIAAISMKQFGLEGKDIPHIADLLAAGAGKAAGDVEDLSQALNQSALVAAQTGLSIEETTGILAAFADAGLVGSDAGTSLKTALQRLTPISEQSQKAMDDLGISAYDAQGQFIGAAAFAGNLQDKLKGLTTEQRNAALAQIFGSDAVRAAAVLYEQGAVGIQKYIDQTNDSGFAAKVAADRLDNLKGDVEKLGGAFDTFAIQSGSGMNDSLRAITQGLTFLLDVAGDLPQPLLDVGTGLGTVAAVIGTTSGAALLAIPKISDLKSALNNLGVTGRVAAGGIGAASVALGAVLLAFTAIAGYEADRASAVDSFADSLDKATGAATDYTRELIVKALAEEGAVDIAKELGLTTEELIDLTMEGSDAITAWANARRTANAEDAAVGAQYDTIAGGLEVVSQRLDAGKDKWDLLREATEQSAAATAENDAALAALEGRAASTGDEIDRLAATVRGFADATLNTRDAQRKFQEAIDDASASLAANGATLDINTEQGRANEAALDAIAQAAQEVAGSLIDQGASQEEVTAAIAAGRGELITALAQYQVTGQAAEAYADSLGLIPSDIGTAADLNISPAMARLQQIKDSFAAFQATGLNLTAYIRTVGGRADGGPIFGVGGSRQDNIPIMASVGEHMLNAEDVNRMGGHGGVYAFRRSLYLADGGPVLSRATQPPTYVTATYVPTGNAPSTATTAGPSTVRLSPDDPVVLAQSSVRDLVTGIAGVVRVQSRTGGTVENG